MPAGLKQRQNLNQFGTNSRNLFLFPYKKVTALSPSISTILHGREGIPHHSSWSSEECLAATYTLDYTSTPPASLHSASHLHSLLFRWTKINRRFVILPHSNIQRFSKQYMQLFLLASRKPGNQFESRHCLKVTLTALHVTVDTKIMYAPKL